MSQVCATEDYKRGTELRSTMTGIPIAGAIQGRDEGEYRELIISLDFSIWRLLLCLLCLVIFVEDGRLRQISEKLFNERIWNLNGSTFNMTG
jgi:hypothetical protein